MILRNNKSSPSSRLFCLIMFLIISPAVTNNARGALLSKPALQEEDSIRTLKDLVFFAELSLIRLDIIPPSSGVQFYRDGIIYLHDTKTGSKNLEIAFGSIDTYYAPLEERGLGPPEIFSRRFAFPFPSESVSFTEDGNTMFFTRKTEFSATGRIIEKIYQTEYITSSKRRKTGWSDRITELPFNGEDYSCTQPSVSADGNLMVFSSDMPGGQGGFDLYIVIRTGEDWGKPVNPGPDVNTTGNEKFPFLLNSGTLFFSSDGHPGYGGYDLFLSKFDGKTWSGAINLGEAVNSPDNELSFVMDRDNPTRAFFSSTRFQPRQVLKLFDATLVSGENVLASTVPAEALQLGYHSGPTAPAPVLETVTPPAEKKADPVPEVKKEEKAPVVAETRQEEPPKPAVEAVAEKKPEVTEPVVKPADVPKPAVPETRAEPAAKPPETKPEEAVDFRVQIKSSAKSLGSFTVTIDGTPYQSFEYFYAGAYRYTIGHFSRVTPAAEFQKKCREAGYPEAFVAAFKNNIRILDREVFQKYR